MATYFTNAFSLNMLASPRSSVEVYPMSVESVRSALQAGVTHAVGHADTAAVLSEALGTKVPCQRVTVTLEPGDCAIVAQYKGPRLPEGATTLPEGATIEFLLVDVESPAPQFEENERLANEGEHDAEQFLRDYPGFD